MPLRTYTDPEGQAHFTAICDRCLRVGPTCLGFVEAAEGFDVPNAQGAAGRIEVDGVTCAGACQPITTVVARDLACPECDYALTWHGRLADLSPYVPGEPCPECGAIRIERGRRIERRSEQSAYQLAWSLPLPEYVDTPEGDSLAGSQWRRRIDETATGFHIQGIALDDAGEAWVQWREAIDNIPFVELVRDWIPVGDVEIAPNTVWRDRNDHANIIIVERADDGFVYEAAGDRATYGLPTFLMQFEPVPQMPARGSIWRHRHAQAQAHVDSWVGDNVDSWVGDNVRYVYADDIQTLHTTTLLDFLSQHEFVDPAVPAGIRPWSVWQNRQDRSAPLFVVAEVTPTTVTVAEPAASPGRFARRLSHTEVLAMFEEVPDGALVNTRWHRHDNPSETAIIVTASRAHVRAAITNRVRSGEMVFLRQTFFATFYTPER